jgi:hypothetical protein
MMEVTVVPFEFYAWLVFTYFRGIQGAAKSLENLTLFAD